MTIVITLSGCAQIEFKQKYDKGMKAYNDKKYDLAIENFNQALNYRPTSYSTLCVLGTSYAYVKDFKMAEKTFKDAIKLYPNEWNAYVLLADVLKSRHEYGQAIDYYEIAVSLESMGGKEKTYYKKLVRELKTERNEYNMRKKDSLNSAIFDTKVKSAEPKNKDENNDNLKNSGDVFLELNMKDWQEVLNQKDDKAYIVEYGLKGEDVKNNKWTKLVTVQYFLLNENFKTTLSTYYYNHIGAIETIAKNSNKNFEKKIISQKNNEIIYEWSFDNAKESEIARIVFIDKHVYHIHCAKKGAISDIEKKEFLELLKTAVLR